MNKTCLLALLVLVSATGASAADTDKDKSEDSATTASDQQAAPKKDKLICRSSRATGSLTRVNRVCHTRADWDQIAENARKNVNDISRRQNVGADSGSANGANNASGL